MLCSPVDCLRCLIDSDSIKRQGSPSQPVVDLTVNLKTATTYDAIKAAMKEASEKMQPASNHAHPTVQPAPVPTTALRDND